jgi:hypothetical protein
MLMLGGEVEQIYPRPREALSRFSVFFFVHSESPTWNLQFVS